MSLLVDARYTIMTRPRTPHVDWQWEWKDNGQRFHVPHFITDENERGWGHGSRALEKIVEWAFKEHGATVFSIQMGGGAPSARWLDSCFEHHLYVKDVQGYSDHAWKDPTAEREDGREDTEGDNASSVYAEIDDLEYLAWERGWIENDR